MEAKGTALDTRKPAIHCGLTRTTAAGAAAPSAAGGWNSPTETLVSAAELDVRVNTELDDLRIRRQASLLQEAVMQVKAMVSVSPPALDARRRNGCVIAPGSARHGGSVSPTTIEEPGRTRLWQRVRNP